MSPRYLWFIDETGDGEPDRLIEVPEDAFQTLRPHTESLGRGGVPRHLQDFLEPFIDQARDGDVADLRPSEVKALPFTDCIVIALR